jgi:hypothetical protein
VFAASSIPNDRLGETMLERGSISEYEFILASSLMKTEGRKFGEALVRIGLISPGDLERQLRHQFNRIVLSLFQVREGIYSFEERVPSIPNDLMIELAVPYLLLDGLRSVSDDRLLFSCLPFPISNLRVKTRGFSNFDVTALTPEELTVLRIAREGINLETILSEVGGDTYSVLRLCGALSLLGFLELENAPERHEDVRQTIMNTFDRTERMSESQILETPPAADRDTIERAYALKRLEWSQIQELAKADPSLEHQVYEIQFRLAAAYHRLLLEQQPRAEEKKVSVSTGLSIPASTPPKPAIGVKDAGPGSTTVTSGTRETDLLDGVKARFQAQDWEGAIPLLHELIDLAPRNASYRGFLAKAMFKHPFMRRKAERHFLEAVRLSPRDPKLHMWLGLYYKASGKRARAANAFRMTLDLDPNNPVAKKYLLKLDHAGRHKQNGLLSIFG